MITETATEQEPAKRQVVRTTVDKLRERIYAKAANEQIGSLRDLARECGVGIVTIQQAARILEHEGILEVRRGPGGGYYGRRPDLRDMERVLGAYLQSEPASWKEVLDITSLLFNQLCSAAARCADDLPREELRTVAQKISACEDSSQLGALETELQEVLFRMVRRPLFELLTRVVLGTAQSAGSEDAMRNFFGFDQWKESRASIIAAILAQDAGLAHFQANRLNREVLVQLCGLQSY
ncbi:GntR family transcriptional regulator [Novosphingobium sp. M1R2S20]|uniref:GntR family transcriptional regulator n=1 Tax=Novosphingobium rhizovicinum TaxID=3228928 RepID=A0ABV3R7J3_9SPHN